MPYRIPQHPDVSFALICVIALICCNPLGTHESDHCSYLHLKVSAKIFCRQESLVSLGHKWICHIQTQRLTVAVKTDRTKLFIELRWGLLGCARNGAILMDNSIAIIPLTLNRLRGGARLIVIALGCLNIIWQKHHLAAGAAACACLYSAVRLLLFKCKYQPVWSAAAQRTPPDGPPGDTQREFDGRTQGERSTACDKRRTA